MLKAEKLTKSYGDTKVLDGASFYIGSGELVSVVGPSGQGKSTAARILCGAVIPDAGTVELDGRPLFKNGVYDRSLCREIQLIPQQPFASLDPRQTVESAVAEPLLFHRLAKNRAQALGRARELLEQMRLEPGLGARRPGELSGGQAQRVLIARAMTLSPSLLIADEATSMLDMSSQAQIIRIFRELIHGGSVSVLLISHDRPLVEAVSDRIYSLSCGKMEEAPRPGGTAPVPAHTHGAGKLPGESQTNI